MEVNRKRAKVHMLPTEDEGTMQIWHYPRVKDELRYSMHKELRKEVGNYLYITDDSEIKEGDWYLDTETNEVKRYTKDCI